VSVKPKETEYGDENAPNSVTGRRRRAESGDRHVLMRASTIWAAWRIASSNILAGCRDILEPILMNVGLCIPQPGPGRAAERFAIEWRAVLIFDDKDRRELVGRRERLFRRKRT